MLRTNFGPRCYIAGMKAKKVLLALVLIIVVCYGQEVLSQVVCPVGDTCFVGKAFALAPAESKCGLVSYGYLLSYTHVSGKDFFIKGIDYNLFFAPKSVGEQIDTILLLVRWQTA